MASRRLVELKSSGLAATVDPHGAQLTSLETIGGERLLWRGDPAWWPDHAPILFPVIGPLVGGVFRHNGQTYPMPPHGFAHRSDFAIAERAEGYAVFELSDDANTRAHYPFAFRLAVEHRLGDDHALITISVENRGGQVMPADVGFHPGFSWPLTAGRDKEDYAIVFDQAEPEPIRRGTGDPIALTPDPAPTPVEGNVLRLRDDLFEGGPLVWDELRSRSVIYGAQGSRRLRVDFPDSPHLGIWTKPGAPFVCIEPWQGLPTPVDFKEPFIEKPGTAKIEPGQIRIWRLRVTSLPE